MYNHNTDLEQLEREYGQNKKIPKAYKKPILIALAHYPALKHTYIHFETCQKQNVAYRTLPSAFDMLREPEKRVYRILITEEARPPMQQALLKNCPPAAQIGVMAHELAHVLQFSRQDKLGLTGFLMSYLFKYSRKKIERGADKLTILHGLGKELYTHALYIRSIPGYIQQNPSLEKDYLSPGEILALTEELKSQKVGT